MLSFAEERLVNYLRNEGDYYLSSILHIPRTETFMNFYDNRIIPLWNNLPLDVRTIELTDMGFNSNFKNDLKKLFMDKLENNFDTDRMCTWLSVCRCATCRS